MLHFHLFFHLFALTLAKNRYICNIEITIHSSYTRFAMTNKRDLKRTINYICSDLFAECVAASLYSGKPDVDNVDAILASILHIQNDYVKRISHPEPGMKPRLYFKNLTDSFNEHVSEVIDQISNLD